MENIFEFIPYLVLAAFGLICILSVSGSKYSIKTTLLITIPITFLILIVNTMIFDYLKMDHVSIWNVLGLFIPETLLVLFIGKRKKVSLFTGIINAFLVVYFVVLIDKFLNMFITNTALYHILYYGIVYPAGFFYLNLFYNKLHDITESVLPKMLWLLLAYAIIIFAEIWLYSQLITITDVKVVGLNSLSFALFAAYIVSIIGFYLFIKFFQEEQITNFNNARLEKQINKIIEISNVKDQKENEIRILRHDLKHVLITINTLINDGEIEKAKEIINSYHIEIDNTKKMRYCQDYLINSVLEYYQQQCEINKINFKTKINNFEELLQIPSKDIVIVISNCLDNAINASLKVSSNRYISFIFLNNKGRLILQIKNKFDGNITLDDTNSPFNDEENHGFGTKSIKLFCKKHNITLDYTITKTSFEITMLFNDSKKK